MQYQQHKVTGFLVALVVFCLFLTPAMAQNMTQTLKGVVLDKALKTPLIGATVVLKSVEPMRGATTDVDGNFRLPNVPVGKHTLYITYLGYKEAFVPNITLNSGKETEVTIQMEESIIQGKEVVITAKVNKQKALNELSTVSARTFSVEETQRFAAAVNDPARMASAFAGVAAPGDGNNIIVIRGNAPNGLLWRMEGVDIPNPNHFSRVGTSGGGISILSAQLLTNSDFLTGAFPAEYGNALSGVFDLKMRKGNSEKREYTLQAGVLGLDAAAEGPFRMGKRSGSYLVNYRYSTLSIIGKLGVNLGDAVTNFQDLSFNIWMPAGKAGTFTLFGLSGLSSQKLNGTADSLLWRERTETQYNADFKSNTGVVGLTHSLILGDRTALKNVVAISATNNGDETDQFLDDYSARRLSDNDHIQRKMTISSTLNHKFNPKNLLRVGGYVNFLDFNFTQNTWNNEADRLIESLKNTGNATSVNTFAQWQYKPSEKITLSGGAHGNFFLLNNTWSLEPRASAKYAFTDRQSISLGYGKHSQSQPLGVYFTKVEGANGVFSQPNQNLGLTQSHHFVLSFDQNFSGNWHIKPEVYFQAIEQAPVSSLTSDAFSVLNVTEGFVEKSLVNGGKGRNYGLEITVEKFLTNGFYCLLSSSLFESKYQGSDKVWHNTRFNSNYVTSFVAGKEWNWNNSRKNKNRTFGVNIKLTQMGGLRETPIDLEASIQNEAVTYATTGIFEDKMPDYFRLDTGVRLKRNYNGVTTTLSLDLQNTTNRKNVFGRYYDVKAQEVKFYYQTPLIPVLAYKVEF
jgi:hypothetical protein